MAKDAASDHIRNHQDVDLPEQGIDGRTAEAPSCTGCFALWSISIVSLMPRVHVAPFFVATAAAWLLGAPMALAGSLPPSGVYSCYDARMAFSPIQGSHLEITPTPVAMFGLIDDATYADWDGHHGHYNFEPGSGVLTMTDGSRQGWRYKKVAEWSFSLIDNRSGKEIYTCPFDARKNPSRGPW